MGNETREFLAAVAGHPGNAMAGHWEEPSSEDASPAARDELRALGMEEGRVVPFLAGLYRTAQSAVFHDARRVLSADGWHPEEWLAGYLGGGGHEEDTRHYRVRHRFGRAFRRGRRRRLA